jgi:hypothetical protein
MAAVLIGYVDPTPSHWAARDEDIATMIRDVAQLGDTDIQVLGILSTVYANTVAHMPNLQDPHQFSKETKGLKTAIAVSGLHRDDYLSTCERLRGFGLAAEVVHLNPTSSVYSYFPGNRVYENLTDASTL